MAHFEAKSNIIGNRHMRKQRVTLKNNAEIALVNGRIGVFLSVDKHNARTRLYEPAQDAKRRCFSAAGRAKQRYKLAFLNVQGQLVQYLLVAVV